MVLSLKEGESNVWEILSLYESTDLLSEYYRNRHDQRLAPAKAREIVSHFIQGREYFASARQSSELVRPLVLYYGVLALDRGLILFLDTSKSREAALAKAHGLDAFNWEQDLARGVSALPDLKVKLARGTFSEFSNATRNLERALIFSEDSSSRPWLNQEGTKGLPQGHAVRLRDILARLPDIYRLYERTFNEASECYPAIVTDSVAYERAVVHVLRATTGLPTKEHIRETFQIPESVPITLDNTHPFSSDEEHHRLQWNDPSSQERRKHLPPVRNNREAAVFLVTPLPGGLRLSTPSVLYLVAYIAGMLVRYYPSIWFSLVNRERGDFAFPLLRAAIAVAEQRFPELVAQELESTDDPIRRGYR